jgi:hypothetical protein
MSLLQIADSTGRMSYVCSNAAKHELEPVPISAHCVLFHRKPSPEARSSHRASYLPSLISVLRFCISIDVSEPPEQAMTAKRKTRSRYIARLSDEERERSTH